MMKMAAKEITWFNWVCENAKETDVIGFDFTQYPAAFFDMRFKAIKEKGLKVESTPNLVDLVWGSDKPARPCEPVKVWPAEYAGMNPFAKFPKMCEAIGNVDMLLVTALDQIAWCLNLRGADIKCNPVFFSYLVWYPGNYKSILFCDKNHFDAESLEYLDLIQCEVQPYEAIVDFLQKQAADKKKVGVDLQKANSEIRRLLGESAVEKNGKIELLKACKTATEVQGMQDANTRDCAAIMKYFAFLEEELKKPDHGMDEFKGAEKVLEYRKQNDKFQYPSFDSISSMGSNGAVIHYKPEADTAKPMNNDEIYLLDSGGQYLDGTTDITRTAHFGGKEPTDFQKEAYTRVLMGTLDLLLVEWPANQGVSGSQMDILARQNLWRAGLDFGHGTGHGVGTYLNVHEGPQGISRYSYVELKEGMCVSDEPGYYKDGEFGIRIENVIAVQKHPKFEGFYHWKNFTVAPYCRDLIKPELLTEE